MEGWRQVRKAWIVLVLLALADLPKVFGGDELFVNIKEFLSGEEQTLTLKDVACLVDCVDKELFKKGTIGVKSPDVWGQNRMTSYRAEFEGQMAQNLGQFQTILQAAQRRSDTAVLTNATQLAATVTATAAAKPRGLLGRPRGAAPRYPCRRRGASTAVCECPSCRR